MAQPTAQPTPIWISLREAHELALQRYLSLKLAGERVVEWLADKKKPVRWRYEHIENNSGVPTETALEGFWRLGVLPNWEESSAARKVEPRTAAGAPEGMAPAGVVRWVSYPKPRRPSSQLGSSYNFFVYGIRLAHEDIQRRLRRYDAPASVADSAPSPESPAELRVKPMDWLALAYKLHPRKKGEQHTDWAGRLSVLMRDAPVTKRWDPVALNRRLYDLEKDERKRRRRD